MLLDNSTDIKNNIKMENKKNSREIDIVGIAKKIFSEWKTLLVFVVVSAVIGVIVALNTPKSYTTTVILAPELSNGGALPEGLSNIASMVGMDLGGATGGGMDAIYPQIYPDVLTSSDFILKLFDVKVKANDMNVSKSYYDHLVNDSKIPFWNYPKVWLSSIFKSKGQKGHENLNPFNLTKEQDNVLNAVRSNISCIVDKNTNVISISVTDEDSRVSAIMADTIQKQLQKYITVYRTKKANNDLAYTKRLFSEATAQYIHAQEVYASYADANEDLLLESFKAKRDELENEMQLRYNIYNQTALQLQAAKAKVQERTPVFSVIQSSTIPIKASSTPRLFIVVAYIFLGAMLDALWILYIREWYKSRKNKTTR